MSSLVTKAEHAALRERTEAWSRAGVPEALVESVGGLQFLLPAVDIVRVAELGRVTLEVAGQLYFRVGRKFGFEWLRGSSIAQAMKCEISRRLM